VGTMGQHRGCEIGDLWRLFRVSGRTPERDKGGAECFLSGGYLDLVLYVGVGRGAA